jgi:hypothetical protein
VPLLLVVRLLLAVMPSVLAPRVALLLLAAESRLVVLGLRPGRLQPVLPLLPLHLPAFLRVLRPAW